VQSVDETGYASYQAMVSTDVTDESTMAWPSTADSAISVGATYANDLTDDNGTLGVTDFSGRGPRIDGVLSIDVVAPHDDYAAAPGAVGGLGNYSMFGGTSGATPQVAGAMALLVQLQPDITPAQASLRLTASATALAGVGPSPAWGYGRLATYRLLVDTAPPINHAPALTLIEPDATYVGSDIVIDARATSDAEDAAASLFFRWDVDYDGDWDVTGLGENLLAYDLTAVGTHWVKVEVEDRGGLTAHRLVKVVGRSRQRRDIGEPVSPGSGCNALPDGSSSFLLLFSILAYRRGVLPRTRS
jgi:subtilisin family serine protease